jgi:hypothetical protein
MLREQGRHNQARSASWVAHQDLMTKRRGLQPKGATIDDPAPNQLVTIYSALSVISDTS